MIRSHKYFPILVWFFPLLFFAYQFILRLWPGLLMNQIMQQFSIDAVHFGIIAAFYYYGYSVMQIPVAILLDKFSTRRIICIFSITCGLATLLFVLTNNFYVAVFSRFMIGAASAAGFLCVSKVITQWFPKDQYAKMVGFSFSFGLVGAIYGGKPISLLIEKFEWQNVALCLVAFSFIIACGAFFVVRKPSKSEASELDQDFKISYFMQILSSPTIWCLAISNFLMVGALEGFADVWGVPFLMKYYDFTKSDAAGIVSFIFVGMLFGGPLLAIFSKKFGYYAVISASGIGIAACFFVILNYDYGNQMFLSAIFFAIGIMCCYQVIVFALGVELVSKKNLGITIAFLNCVNMLGGSFFHTIIGYVMDVLWKGDVNEESVRIYDFEAYKYALSIIPVCALIGGVIIMCIAVRNRKESYNSLQAE